MATPVPFNLYAWIDQNRGLLKPPVGNKLLFEDSEFIIMAVGGPNSRQDFHHDPGPEFFYQLEGAMVLRTIQAGRLTDVPIRAGEVYLLPPEVPHSPQRPAGSVGIVVERGGGGGGGGGLERRRGADELDGFSWYCKNCGNCLHLERVAVHNIETQLPEIFSRFYSSIERRTCAACGTILEAPPASAADRA
jgi:3-hydroxyanthranilate 3,4-dioxygenase